MADADGPCANPLLLGWVKEWVDLARERNSKGLLVYKHAYDALKACPITFKHPSQLQQLKGFGPKLCERLTEKLTNHCRENGLPMPKRPRQWRIPGLDDEDVPDDEPQPRPSKRQSRPKPYVPTLRSGAYALILGLATLDEGSHAGLSKNDLIKVAQPHCDSSLSAPSDPTKFYTAWNSMKTLVDKDLVYERGRPLRKYFLSDQGWEVARRLQQTADLTPAELAALQRGELPAEPEAPQPPARSPSVEIEEIVANGDSTSSDTPLPTFRPIRVAPGKFKVHLVLDNREVRAKTDRDYIQQELIKRGVEPITRSLEIGDALWVAKCDDPNFLSRTGAEGDEVVLDWIVERKRLDDLIGSIKDGRFHEQKFRLKRSGIKNVVYIVEEMSMDSTVLQKYDETIQSAIASTQVVNGYFLKKTQKVDDTIRYLAQMTKLLISQYESKSLFVIPTEVLTPRNYLPLLQHLREKEPTLSHYISYPAFASLASKSDNITLRDIYLKMLMCTKQVSGDKALEIQKRWKTPYELVKAYEDSGVGEAGKKRKQDLVSAQMGNLVGRKRITRPLSHKIGEVWGDA